MKHSAPHYEVKGVTKPPERPHFTRAAESGKKKASAKIGVYLQLYRRRNFVSKMSSSNVAGWKKKTYQKPSGAPYTGLGGEEMAEHITNFLRWCRRDRKKARKKKEGQSQGAVPAQPRYLLLDNDPSHKTARVREACKEYGVKLIFTPPRSPDLNPNDSKHNAVCKNELRAQTLPDLDWSTRAQKFASIFKAEPQTQHIINWVLRLVACKEAYGLWFEDKLKAVKARAKVTAEKIEIDGVVIAYMR